MRRITVGGCQDASSCPKTNCFCLCRNDCFQPSSKCHKAYSCASQNRNGIDPLWKGTLSSSRATFDPAISPGMPQIPTLEPGTPETGNLPSCPLRQWQTATASRRRLPCLAAVTLPAPAPLSCRPSSHLHHRIELENTPTEGFTCCYMHVTRA